MSDIPLASDRGWWPPPFPNVAWQDHPLGALHPILNYSRPVALPSRVPVEALSAAVLAGNETCEKTASGYAVTVAEVEDAVRFARCWWTRRGAYERSFCR